MYICTYNFVYIYIYIYTCIYLSLYMKSYQRSGQIDCVGLNGHCRDLAFTVSETKDHWELLKSKLESHFALC